jgi:hypothetical protein
MRKLILVIGALIAGIAYFCMFVQFLLNADGGINGWNLFRREVILFFIAAGGISLIYWGRKKRA